MPPREVGEEVERLLERQFLLSPWVREKRLRNQLRLVLKVQQNLQLDKLCSMCC